jgi:hypothetical protein
MKSSTIATVVSLVLALALAEALALTAVVYLVVHKRTESPPQEYEAGRVAEGYRDGGAYKADKVFRGSRVYAEGEVDSVRVLYTRRNPDVKAGKTIVTNLGEKCPDPSATLDGYSVRLVRVNDCDRGACVSVSANFTEGQLPAVSTLEKGQRIRTVGKLGYGMVFESGGVMLYLSECEVLK